jgi:hypothetical protein
MSDDDIRDIDDRVRRLVSFAIAALRGCASFLLISQFQPAHCVLGLRIVPRSLVPMS